MGKQQVKILKQDEFMQIFIITTVVMQPNMNM